MQSVRIVLLHTPNGVWASLIVLLFLGISGLKRRRVHLAVAALPPCGFLFLSLLTASSLAGNHRGAAALSGALSFFLGFRAAGRKRAGQWMHVEGWWFEKRGSPAPLAAYMLLFSLHYALGIWAGFEPALSRSLGVVRLAASAATAGWSISGLALCWKNRT